MRAVERVLEALAELLLLAAVARRQHALHVEHHEREPGLLAERTSPELMRNCAHDCAPGA